MEFFQFIGKRVPIEQYKHGNPQSCAYRLTTYTQSEALKMFHLQTYHHIRTDNYMAYIGTEACGIDSYLEIGYRCCCLSRDERDKFRNSC